jgi:hypothetical protein
MIKPISSLVGWQRLSPFSGKTNTKGEAGLGLPIARVSSRRMAGQWVESDGFDESDVARLSRAASSVKSQKISLRNYFVGREKTAE